MTFHTRLKPCWHPVAFSEQVTNKPYATILLEEPLVIWRTKDNVIHAHKDRCVHRSAALSLGQIIDDSLRCPLHGWRFNAQGTCVDIPQAPAMKIPQKACLTEYTCVERYGIIWVALEKPQFPLPEIPEMAKDDWRVINIGSYTWDCDASRMFENLSDLSHFAWVHHGLVGDREYPEVPVQNVEQRGHALYCNISRADSANPEELPVFASGNQKQPIRHSQYELHLPFTHLQRSNWGGSEGLVYLFVCQPHSPVKSTIYGRIARN